MDAARAEAERLLADARRTGSEAGRRRRDEILAEAEAEARAIRADGEAEVQELRERVSARHDELIAELTGARAPGGGGRRMLVPMTKVRLLGARGDVERVVDELHQLGLVEIADARASLAVDGLGGDEDRSKRRKELRRLAAQTDGLLTLIAGAATFGDAGQRASGRPVAGPRGDQGRAGADGERGRGLGAPAVGAPRRATRASRLPRAAPPAAAARARARGPR